MNTAEFESLGVFFVLENKETQQAGKGESLGETGLS